MEKSWKESVHSFEREHVTQFIVRRPEMFKIGSLKSPIGYFGNHRWTVDEPEDFELVSRIYEHFIKEVDCEHFGYKDILEFLNQNPEVTIINAKYTRNEGLEKSINEDRIVKAGE